MKQSILIFITILTLGFLTSCQQDEILTEEATLTAEVYEASKTGDDIEETDLPEAVTTYIAANYPESTIEQSRATNKGYGVKLDTGEFLVFDLAGAFIGEHTGNGHRHSGHGKPNGHGKPDGGNQGTDIELSDLPTTVTDYIAANYPEATIEGARQGDSGYGVKLDSGVVVIFDAEGNFVTERTGKPGGHGDKGTEIDPSELPTTVTDYIAANYPEATIEGARQGDSGYGVKLDSGVVVIFDAEGNFVTERTGKPDGHGDKGTEIDPSELPTTVTDYIAANYPEATIEGARQGDSGYGVKLDSGVVVIFDAEGAFVAEREGHGG